MAWVQIKDRSDAANLNTAMCEEAAPIGEGRVRHDRGKRDEQETARQPLGGAQGQGGAGRLNGDEAVVEISQQYEVRPSQAVDWRRQLLYLAADVFGGVAVPSAPPVDLKALRAKIDQLALEKDSLGGRAHRGP